MAKGNKCWISNCENILTSHGTTCGKHKWRKKKFNSYDLPSYIGIPNKPIIPKLPEGIVKDCPIHGLLKFEETYQHLYKGKISSYYCRTCIISLHIKNKYKGLQGIECYDELLKKQNGVCAICHQKNNTTHNGKIKRFAIDHNHVTLETRELLCSFCNSILGYARDSIEILKSAIAYLEKHKYTADK